jgi:hypothetical protein
MAAAGNYIVESDVDNWPASVSATETFATTDVDVSTDRITVTNDIATCTELQFSSTGEVPAPLVTGTIYYAIRIDATTIEVASTPVLAAAGTALNLTDVGSGTHTLDIGSGSSTTERQEVIDRAEQLIEKVTRDYFYSKAFSVYRNGNGKDKLSLGFYPDILTVTEILVSGVAMSSSWYTNDTDSVYLDPESATGDELPELFLRLKYSRSIFPKGSGNIKITGTYGWSSCPVAIKQATIMLCRFENDETLYTKYEDVTSEKIDEVGYVRGVKKKYLTGVHEVDRRIRNYIRKKPVMGVA